MDQQIKNRLEQGTQIALTQYRERHPALAGLLEINQDVVLSSLLDSIEDDPEVVEALKMAQAETGLQRIVAVALDVLPKIISVL